MVDKSCDWYFDREYGEDFHAPKKQCGKKSIVERTLGSRDNCVYYCEEHYPKFRALNRLKESDFKKIDVTNEICLSRIT